MKQFQTAYRGESAFRAVISGWKTQACGAALIHLFSDGADPDDIAAARAVIDEVMPEAEYIGASASGSFWASAS